MRSIRFERQDEWTDSPFPCITSDNVHVVPGAHKSMSCILTTCMYKDNKLARFFPIVNYTI